MSQTTIQEVPQTSNFQLREVKQGFVAEIRGLDLMNGASEEHYKRLKAAVDKVSTIEAALYVVREPM